MSGLPYSQVERFIQLAIFCAVVLHHMYLYMLNHNKAIYYFKLVSHREIWSIFKNPIHLLQSCLAVPVFSENTFCPTWCAFYHYHMWFGWKVICWDMLDINLKICNFTVFVIFNTRKIIHPKSVCKFMFKTCTNSLPCRE